MKVGRMLAESEPFPTIKPVGLRSNRRRANDTPTKKTIASSEKDYNSVNKSQNDSKLSGNENFESETKKVQKSSRPPRSESINLD